MSTTGSELTDTGKVIDYRHEGNINSIDIRCRSGGITLTDIAEVVGAQVRLAAAVLGVADLCGLQEIGRSPGKTGQVREFDEIASVPA